MSASRTLLAAVLLGTLGCAGSIAASDSPAAAKVTYPGHTGIVATTFWVGEIFDADAADGSQEISTYDDHWLKNYGGCDGRRVKGECRTEKRTAKNDYFPTQMKPRQNPFYLDLPYDDLNDSYGYKHRGTYIPWARTEPYRSRIKDDRVSLMKDRWVRLSKNGRTCYGQVEDAGPGKYHNKKYVFGSKDSRPSNRRYNRAGVDVSPALNGCLGFSELDGASDKVSWRFVEADAVPDGPWTRIVTTTTWPKKR